MRHNFTGYVFSMHGNPLDNAGVGELIKGLVQTHHFRQSDEERLSKDELQVTTTTSTSQS